MGGEPKIPRMISVSRAFITITFITITFITITFITITFSTPLDLLSGLITQELELSVSYVFMYIFMLYIRGNQS